MDIDNFKVINEVYNVKKGDKVLRDIAKIISKAVAENGIYARLNDDNFAILMKYNSDEDLIDFVDGITGELANYKLNIKLIPSFGIFKISDRRVPPCHRISQTFFQLLIKQRHIILRFITHRDGFHLFLSRNRQTYPEQQ